MVWKWPTGRTEAIWSIGLELARVVIPAFLLLHYVDDMQGLWLYIIWLRLPATGS